MRDTQIADIALAPRAMDSWVIQDRQRRVFPPAEVGHASARELQFLLLSVMPEALA
jgi:hypothetical protein